MRIESNIQKVIFKDGTNLDISDLKEPVFDREKSSPYYSWKNKVKKFQEDILNELDDNIVEQFAKDNFDLLEEGDCDCKDDAKITIDDFEEEELLAEMLSKKLSLKTIDIESLSLFERFFEVLRYINKTEFENFIKTQEEKHFK